MVLADFELADDEVVLAVVCNELDVVVVMGAVEAVDGVGVESVRTLCVAATAPGWLRQTL